MKFVIKKGSGAQPYWWTLVGDNGETLCHSETYASKQSAHNTINAVKRGAAYAATEDKTGESAYSSYYR